MGLESVRYDAFISYRHCELDSFVSENLHKKLESFKLPKSVVKKYGLKKTRIERVFRDEAELPLSEDLSDPIMAALNNSEFLIVICTPRLSLSKWCLKEIETFLQNHERKNVLLVLAEGEPNESFPEIVTYEDIKTKDVDGNEVFVRREREPLAADCRGENNKQRLKAMDNAVLKLCAAIFGLNYDDLKQRHREQQIKRRMILMEIIMAVVALFAIVCILFTVRLNRQNKIIQEKYAGSMAGVSEELFGIGRRRDAVYAARSVLPDHASKGYNEDAYRALVKALGVYGFYNSFLPESVVGIPAKIVSFQVSKDREKMMILSSDCSLVAMEIKTGKILIEIPNVEIYDYNFSGNDGIIYSTYDEIRYADIESGEETILESGVGRVVVSPVSDITCTLSGQGIRGYKGQNMLYEINYAKAGIQLENGVYSDVYMSEDADYAACVFQEEYYDGEAWVIQFEPERGKMDMGINILLPEEVEVATDGKYVYLDYIKEDEGMEQACTILSQISVAKKKYENAVSVSGEDLNCDLLVNPYGICIYGNNEAMLFDYALEYAGVLTRGNMIQDVFSYEDGFGVIDSFGQVYFLSNFYDTGADLTGRFFPAQKIAHNNLCRYRDGRFYIQFDEDKSSVAVYVPHNGEGVTLLGDVDPEESVEINRYDIQKPDEEYSSSISGEALKTAILSDDGKYYAAQSSDGETTFLDAASGREIRTIYLDGYLCGFHRIDQYDCYIVSDSNHHYFFDSDFRCFTEIDGSAVAGIASNGKDPVIYGGYGDYYAISLYSYEEILKKADELLGNYVPGERIREKYNIR